MSEQFRTGSVHKVDAKGRVSVPAQFRRVLEAEDPAWEEGQNPSLTLVIGPPQQRFLKVYTQAAIATVDAMIARLPRHDERRKQLLYTFYDRAVKMQTDDNGRLILSTAMREKVGITDEARFVAMGDTFHIWAADLYQDREIHIEASFDDHGEDFDPDDLLNIPGAEAPVHSDDGAL